MQTRISKCIKTLLWLLLCVVATHAQAQVMDRVVAVVDDEIVLQSDLDNQYEYMVRNGQKDDGTMRCSIFENALTTKLLLVKARLDSLKLSDDQVEQELERRLAYMSQQMGSYEEVEKVYKKKIIEIKVELRPNIREQMLVEQMRGKIFDGISATPKEVKDFFSKIPTDSLPYLPAEVELSQIVMKPKANKASRDAAREKLKEIRRQIMTGEMRFEQMARFYSQDGSAERDGSLGEFGRGMMAPEFEEVVYGLNEGQVSEVFETPFGFHLAKLTKKLGDRVRASHIIIIPEITKADEELTKQELARLRTRILKDSISFEKAALEYSEDKQTKDNGGIILNQGNDPRIPLDQLDADLYFKVDRMKENEIGDPLEMKRQQGEPIKSFHIVKLRRRLPPHIASLKEDYQKFHNATIQSKQAAALEAWFKKARQQVVVEIKDNSCSQALQNWY